jgi:ATP-dependent RNA helicase RhlB
LSTEENAKANAAQDSDSNRKPRRRRRSRKPRTGDAQPRQARQQKQHDASGRWTPAQFQVPPADGKKRFHDFNLPDVLMHAIADQGFQYCTPIQAETIEPALAGRDIIGKAQTGTGKTAAFLIGIITDLLDFPIEGQRKLAEPRALIIAPTRELALQIAADAEGLCRYAGLSVVSLVGGMDYDRQRKELARGPVDILVATPGRLIDFVRGNEVDLFHVEVLVLDEADRMLSMGFIPDVRTIIRQTPRKGPERQTLLYSATFTDDILRLAQQWTVDPVRIEIESEHKTTDNVSQKVFLVSSSEKYRLLINYLHKNGIERAIVFCNRRHETRKLAERLERDGLRAALMSGEIPQNKRLKTLEDFRSGKIQVLVATDVAGRGIHIDGVTHVINYQLPEDPDDYVHRIGRTGRAGATGTSICFACEDDSFMIPQIEEETGVKLECIHPEPELLEAPLRQAASTEAKPEGEAAATEPEQNAPQPAESAAASAADAQAAPEAAVSDAENPADDAESDKVAPADDAAPEVGGDEQEPATDQAASQTTSEAPTEPVVDEAVADEADSAQDAPVPAADVPDHGAAQDSAETAESDDAAAEKASDEKSGSEKLS